MIPDILGTAQHYFSRIDCTIHLSRLFLPRCEGPRPRPTSPHTVVPILPPGQPNVWHGQQPARGPMAAHGGGDGGALDALPVFRGGDGSGWAGCNRTGVVEFAFCHRGEPVHDSDS